MEPPLKGDITELEKVQKFALRICTKSCQDTSYDELLAASKLPSLESRHNHTSMCHLFKIINELTYYPEAPISQQQFQYNSRSAGSNVLTVPKFHTSSHQHSFFPSTITKWNMLPAESRVSSTLSTKSFKKSLSKS